MVERAINHRNEPKPDDVDALATLCAFLGWAETDGCVYGGRTVTETLEALSVITGIPVNTIRRVAGVTNG